MGALFSWRRRALSLFLNRRTGIQGRSIPGDVVLLGCNGLPGIAPAISNRIGIFIINFPFQRIVDNVLADIEQFPVVADDVVMEIALPQFFTGRFANSIDFARRY